MKKSNEITFNLLSEMIKHYNRLYQEISEEIDFFYSTYLSKAKEYHTIKFCLPRQSGHTYSINCLLQRKEFCNSSIIIIPKFIRRTQYNNFKDVYTIDGFKFMGRGKKFSNVIIDCASFFSKSQIDEIYKMFETKLNENFLFLFLE